MTMMFPFGFGDGGLGAGGWIAMVAMMFFMMLVVIGGILLLVWLVRSAPGPYGPRQAQRDSALEIARERLARGEITKEQFEEIRRSLGS